jgi:hypothetical protein
MLQTFTVLGRYFNCHLLLNINELIILLLSGVLEGKLRQHWQIA